MIKIVEETQDKIHLHFSGFIGESWEWDPGKLNDSVKEIVIDSEEVRAISSIGIAKWLNSFRPLRDKGVKLKFPKCSPVFIRQGAMLVEDFILPSEIVKACLPYYCEDCDTETYNYLEIEKLEELNFEPPPISCPHCGSENVEFDDEPSFYFKIFQN